MDDGVQFRQAAGVGEDEGGEAMTVDMSVGVQDIAAEFANCRMVGFSVRRKGLVAEVVSMDQMGAQGFERPSDERFSAGQAASESYSEGGHGRRLLRSRADHKRRRSTPRMQQYFTRGAFRPRRGRSS